MDHSTIPDEGNRQEPYIQKCTASDFVEIVLFVSSFYAEGSQPQTEKYYSICNVMAGYLSEVLEVNMAPHGCFTDYKKSMPATDLLRPRLQQQFRSLQQVPALINQQGAGQTVTFQELTEYIESKRTVESLARILLSLIKT